VVLHCVATNLQADESECRHHGLEVEAAWHNKKMGGICCFVVCCAR